MRIYSAGNTLARPFAKPANRDLASAHDAKNEGGNCLLEEEDLTVEIDDFVEESIGVRGLHAAGDDAGQHGGGDKRAAGDVAGAARTE
ncbi:hypothetical protein [Candidatus Accumulibacter aalborgensis]|uniref:hypothetical protein n=1 Tax=Candidatus Accumulibacter aalborgensis TaxID=1860102 RepID=UPI0016488FDA|nr:hypothetical protein [Candidatus Accumulibacter aalborgensis]